MTPVGLEPTIPGSAGRCLIYWATGPLGVTEVEKVITMAQDSGWKPGVAARGLGESNRQPPAPGAAV